MQCAASRHSRSRRAIAFMATGFGLGYSPVASGTVGSLWGVVIVGGMAAWGFPLWLYLAACIGLSALAVPICDIAEGVFGGKDDGRIVADEFMTFPICMIGLPVSMDYAWVLPFAFCSCRLFDILKLPPARQFERLPGGIGIVLDDAAASVYSLALNWAVFLIVA